MERIRLSAQWTYGFADRFGVVGQQKKASAIETLLCGTIEHR
jgi:hypothetical protein